MATTSTAPAEGKDDTLTICAISLVAGMIGNMVHEGLGHGATALLTGAKSGVLTTVAWSSDFDSRLVDAGGTLANLAAAAIFWIVLGSWRSAPVRLRFFLLISLAFNLFDGTGYFLFSGVSNFGDWAMVIAGLPAHGLWRAALVVVGAASYFGAVLIVGSDLVRYVGVPRNDPRRLRKLTLIPYFSSIFFASAGALLNPLGMQLLWLSALPATAGGQSGLVWLIHYIPKSAVPERNHDSIGRSYAWIVVAAGASVIFLLVLGRGITLRR